MAEPIDGLNRLSFGWRGVTPYLAYAMPQFGHCQSGPVSVEVRTYLQFGQVSMLSSDIPRTTMQCCHVSVSKYLDLHVTY